MLTVIRMFFRGRDTNAWMVLLCLLLAGLTGSFGLATLLPLLAVVTGDESDNSIIGKIASDLLDFLGLSADIGPLLLLAVAGVILKSLLTIAAMRYVSSAAANIVSSLRIRMLRLLLNVKWTYFVGQQLGILANAVSLEANQAGRAYHLAAMFLANSIQALMYIVVAVAISWKLSVAAVLIGGIIALSLNVLVEITKRQGHREMLGNRELLSFLVDALNSIKPLKAMAKQGHFAQLSEQRIVKLKKALRRRMLSLEARRSLEDAMGAIFLGVAFFLAVGVFEYPLSEVLVMGLLLSQTMKNIGKIQENLQKAVQFQSPFQALQGLISEIEAEREQNSGNTSPTLERRITLESVAFSYSTKRVLTEVNMEIPVGEITVLTGGSGAGKTTITDLIVGLYHPDRGAVRIDGVSLPEIDMERWRGMIGYVPQELILFHDTVIANVALGDHRLSEADVRAALEAAGAWEFVAQLSEGMHSTVGEKGAMLSGGQRQRIALARALATNPKLLILDEVTSALDPDTEGDICRLIQSLAQDRAIIAITHRPAFLGIADRLYRLRNGCVEKIESKETALLDSRLVTGT